MIGIAQTALNHFGRQTMGLLPQVPLTYREVGTLHASTSAIVGAWMRPTEDEKALTVALSKRCTLRVANETFATAPALDATLQDAVTQTLWQIKSLSGGAGHAFWFLHCQQVG